MILARIGAVALALGVLGWFVWDAQRRADARAADGAGAADGETAGGEPAGAELPAALPSSKVLVLEPAGGFLPSSKSGVELPAALPSSKGVAIDPDVFLSGSKSGVIPTPEPTHESPVKEFLFSSKSAALPVTSPTTSPVTPPEQPKAAGGTKPAATGGSQEPPKR